MPDRDVRLRLQSEEILKDMRAMERENRRLRTVLARRLPRSAISAMFALTFLGTFLA